MCHSKADCHHRKANNHWKQFKENSKEKVWKLIHFPFLLEKSFQFHLHFRLLALNQRSTSESPESTFQFNITNHKSLARSNTEIIQTKTQNASIARHNKFETGGLVATAYLKPVKKFKKLSEFTRTNCEPGTQSSIGTNDTSICGKITLKKIKTKSKKKKSDETSLSSQFNQSESTASN